MSLNSLSFRLGQAVVEAGSVLPVSPAGWKCGTTWPPKRSSSINKFIAFLVGCIPTPLKNDGVSSSVGMMKFPTYGTRKHVPNHQRSTTGSDLAFLGMTCGEVFLLSQHSVCRKMRLSRNLWTYLGKIIIIH